MDSVKGKVALVTGAAQGIGYSIAHILLQNGAKVCLVDINAKKGTEVTQHLLQDFGQASAIFVACDVTCETDLNNAFLKTKEAFGGLDIVCNNAGILHEGEWKMSVDINLTAVIRGTMLAVEHMGVDNGGKGGVVFNTASDAGLADAMAIIPVYCATKHGVVAFTRSMAANSWFTDKGLRLNCVCPPPVDTDILNVSDKQVYGGKAALDDLITTRVGTCMPVAKVAEAFLQVIQDSSLNGAVILVKKNGAELVE